MPGSSESLALIFHYALDSICAERYGSLVWDVEVTDQFEQWWDTLSVEEQESIEAAVELLEQRGPGLGRPLVDTLFDEHLKELESKGT